MGGKLSVGWGGVKVLCIERGCGERLECRGIWEEGCV